MVKQKVFIIINPINQCFYKSHDLTEVGPIELCHWVGDFRSVFIDRQCSGGYFSVFYVEGHWIESCPVGGPHLTETPFLEMSDVVISVSMEVKYQSARYSRKYGCKSFAEPSVKNKKTRLPKFPISTGQLLKTLALSLDHYHSALKFCSPRWSYEWMYTSPTSCLLCPSLFHIDWDDGTRVAQTRHYSPIDWMSGKHPISLDTRAIAQSNCQAFDSSSTCSCIGRLGLMNHSYWLVPIQEDICSLRSRVRSVTWAAFLPLFVTFVGDSLQHTLYCLPSLPFCKHTTSTENLASLIHNERCCPSWPLSQTNRLVGNNSDLKAYALFWDRINHSNMVRSFPGLFSKMEWSARMYVFAWESIFQSNPWPARRAFRYP